MRFGLFLGMTGYAQTKYGKPGILTDISGHGKLGILREFCATSGKNCDKVFLVRR